MTATRAPRRRWPVPMPVTAAALEDDEWLDALEAGDRIGSLLGPWRPGDPTTGQAVA